MTDKENEPQSESCGTYSDSAKLSDVGVTQDRDTGFLFCPRCGHVVMEVNPNSCCPACGCRICTSRTA
jgi:rubrerythrin